MWVVWAVFLMTAVGLGTLGVVGARWRGEKAVVYHGVGKGMLVLAFGTALFPAALTIAGPLMWAAAYVSFVAIVTAVMTWRAVRRAHTSTA